MELQARQLSASDTGRSIQPWDESSRTALLGTRKIEVWWNKNAGDYAVSTFDLSFSMVFDADDQVFDLLQSHFTERLIWKSCV